MQLFHEKKRRALLEFQSRLLKELSFTSGSLKTQTPQLSRVAAAARDVLDVHFLFTFHPGQDDRQALEFYWSSTPPAPAREAAESAVAALIAADPACKASQNYTTSHCTATPTAFLPDAPAAGFSMRSQSFDIETPRMNGMVGMGLGKPGADGEDNIAAENILVTVINIITSSKALATYRSEIERFATRDPLTGLYNQISFWDLLKYETERSKRQNYRFSLLAVDLDNFKAINDTYGHDTGDLLLKEFAAVLKSAVRGGDIASRYAGDQFMAILPVCDEGQAYIVARRIIENLRESSTALPNGNTVKQTVSIGVAVFPDHAKEAKDLYLLADNMLHQAKKCGKDRLSMPSEHDSIEVLKSMGEKNLLILEALSQRKIVPYFQPIMNMKDMKVEAYEVLTRIIMHDRVIPASEFIETAENMGAIGKIDYQLIELAFAKVKDIKYQGNLFLNLSPKALVLTDFMPTVRKLLRTYDIDASKMVFEITERDTARGLNIIERSIRELKSEGFRFAIDDFGAGYATFHYIKTFSVDFLKVDGEFIRNMNGVGKVDREIVSSIASLAGKLGIKTIAEFVETEEILGQVESAGINYAQGYYIKRPSPELI